MKYRVVARDTEGKVEAYLCRKYDNGGGSEWNAQPEYMLKLAAVFESRSAAATMAESVCYWDLAVGIERDEARKM